jgi:hypothetical protein
LSLQKDRNIKLHRTQPYILRVGVSLLLIAGRCLIVVIPSTMPVVVNLLLKSFYVFNVQYPQQTRVVFNFLQHTVLDMPSNLPAKVLKLYSELI